MKDDGILLACCRELNLSFRHAQKLAYAKLYKEIFGRMPAGQPAWIWQFIEKKETK
jgi:hypothetical protein